MVIVDAPAVPAVPCATNSRSIASAVGRDGAAVDDDFAISGVVIRVGSANAGVIVLGVGYQAAGAVDDELCPFAYLDALLGGELTTTAQTQRHGAVDDDAAAGGDVACYLIDAGAYGGHAGRDGLGCLDGEVRGLHSAVVAHAVDGKGIGALVFDRYGVGTILQGKLLCVVLVFLQHGAVQRRHGVADGDDGAGIFVVGIQTADSAVGDVTVHVRLEGAQQLQLAQFHFVVFAFLVPYSRDFEAEVLVGFGVVDEEPHVGPVCVGQVAVVHGG